ncbi:MAG: hypothetical protein V2A73_09690, partial [Pseudomonadota bacterium]
MRPGVPGQQLGAKVEKRGVSRSVNGLAVLGPLSLVPSSLFNSDDDEGNKELGTRNQELEQP